MNCRELLLPPNLLSLSRIAMTPVIGYFLWKDDPTSTLICVLILILAGITDGLDGFLARRMNLITDLGKTLDPLADKLMAAALIILLVFFRDLPVWLAAVIVGRDVLIVLAGLLLLRGRRIVPGSNLTGKYTFTAIAILLGSYIIRFDFGIQLALPVTLALIALSTFFYARIFLRLRRGEAPPQFEDRPLYRSLRFAASLIFLAVFFYKLFGWMN